MARQYTRNAKGMQTKSRKHQVQALNGSEFEVTSGASGKTYTVWALATGTFQCSCDWGIWHGDTECSHTIAVREWLAESEGRRVQAWASAEAAKTSHRKAEGENQGVWFTSKRAVLS